MYYTLCTYILSWKLSASNRPGAMLLPRVGPSCPLLGLGKIRQGDGIVLGEGIPFVTFLLSQGGEDDVNVALGKWWPRSSSVWVLGAVADEMVHAPAGITPQRMRSYSISVWRRPRCHSPVEAS